MYIDVFISPNIYISLKSSGNVAIRGNADIKNVLANLVVVDIISNLSMFEASIPDGAISSFIVFFFNSPYPLSFSAILFSSSAS